MKGYKVFDKDFKCLEYQYKLGDIFEMSESPILCKKGFHFCTKLADCFSYYNFDPANIVCEIEALGEITKSEENCSKRATNKIKIVRQLTWQEVLDLANTGDRNTGYGNPGDENTGNWNTGDRNTGYGNTGDENTGDWNTGNWNTGDRNTGNKNTGYGNTGDRNTGDWNTGNRNTGRCNSGDWNTGDWNTGNRNTGDENTGDRNTGDWNTGDWNTGNWNTGDRNTGYGNTASNHTGFFNTKPPIIMAFNKPLSTKDYSIPRMYLIYETDTHTFTYKEAWRNAWIEISKEVKDEFKSLPNFDAKIFKEITGIDINRKYKRKAKGTKKND
jgi:hypothetical protein